MFKKIQLIIFVSITTISTAYAQSYQDLNSLIQLATAHIEKVLHEQYGENSDLQVRAGHVDKRVRLTQCQDSPKTEMEFGQIGQKNMMVKISCSQPLAWAIRIPIQIEHFSEIVMTQKRITKDSIITLDDLMLLKKDITQMPMGYFDNVNDVKGQIAKNDIQVGSILKSNMIKQQVLVKRGDQVRILVKAPGITVESNGIAQKDGVQNEVIKVKNAKSNKIIDGTVQETGIVAVFL